VSGVRAGRVRFLSVTFLVALAVAGAGCGGDDEASFCSDLSDLEQSVQELGDVDVVAGGTNALKSALSDVETNATATVDAAKSDFPDETSAITDSIAALKASAGKLSSSPSAAQAATAASDAAAVVTAVNEFADATSSECE
jgi:hypothetical protein